MAISEKEAKEVHALYTKAGQPIMGIEGLMKMWGSRQVEEARVKFARFMPPKRTEKKPDPEKDASLCMAMDFRDFIERFPKESLNGVPKYMVTAVGLVMSNHCTFHTGMSMQLTVLGLSELSGVGRPGVTRVLKLLSDLEAIKKVRGLPHPGARASIEYRFNRSEIVGSVLANQTTIPDVSLNTVDVSLDTSRCIPEYIIREDYKTGSVANAPSPSLSLSPSARSSVEDEEEIVGIKVMGMEEMEVLV